MSLRSTSNPRYPIRPSIARQNATSPSIARRPFTSRSQSRSRFQVGAVGDAKLPPSAAVSCARVFPSGLRLCPNCARSLRDGFAEGHHAPHLRLARSHGTSDHGRRTASTTRRRAGRRGQVRAPSRLGLRRVQPVERSRQRRVVLRHFGKPLSQRREDFADCGRELQAAFTGQLVEPFAQCVVYEPERVVSVEETTASCSSWDLLALEFATPGEVPRFQFQIRKSDLDCSLGRETRPTRSNAWRPP